MKEKRGTKVYKYLRYIDTGKIALLGSYPSITKASEVVGGITRTTLGRILNTKGVYVVDGSDDSETNTELLLSLYVLDAHTWNAKKVTPKQPFLTRVFKKIINWISKKINGISRRSKKT